MRERFTVEITYDQRHGYVASHEKLPAISALSLAVLRSRIEQQLDGQRRDIRLLLGRKARCERDQRRKGGHGGVE